MFSGAEVVGTADGSYDRNPEMSVEEAQVFFSPPFTSPLPGLTQKHPSQRLADEAKRPGATDRDNVGPGSH